MEEPFAPNFQLSGRGDKLQGKLVVASNREPYIHRKTCRGLKLEVPAGGLVSALDAVLRVTGGTWVAWGSGNGDREGTDAQDRLWVPPENPAYRLRRVWLSPEAVKNYYTGFCNSVLWPLFHGERDRIADEGPFWDEYVRTNEIFAEAILSEADEDSAVWIHDYHLCLVPQLIRLKNPERTIAHFWHVPWPCCDLFTSAPHGPQILSGLLGNDLIGFQIPRYAENFLACAAAHLGAAVDREAMTVTWQGRISRIRSFPISTDFNRFDGLAGRFSTDARIQRIRRKYALPSLVGLAVDRLDYTKGILQRLQALELFFQRYRRFRGAFTLIQVAVATRRGNPYLQYRREIEERIARINSDFGTAAWQPVLYLRQKLEPRDLAVYYRLADVAVITPLHDGMNLVAKEYVASRSDGEGVLILGREAGAAEELAEAILIDPYDTERFADAIHQALTLPGRERKERMTRLRKQVSTSTIYSWIGDILDELSLLPVTKRGGRHALTHWEEIADRLAGRKLFLCLDFDGTLAPIVKRPEEAEMPANIRSLLAVLTKRHPIAVISGRSLSDLHNRVNLPDVMCWGNYGAEREGVATRGGDRALLDAFLLEARQAFAELPGILIEDKGITLSIHFRNVEPVLLEKFRSLFAMLCRTCTAGLRFSEGRKVFEIRPQRTMDKGATVQALLEEVGKGRLPIYLGDDTSDEGAYCAVRGTGIAVAVGGSLKADYYLRNQGEVLKFLRLIAVIPFSGGKKATDQERSFQDDRQTNSR